MRVDSATFVYPQMPTLWLAPQGRQRQLANIRPLRRPHCQSRFGTCVLTVIVLLFTVTIRILDVALVVEGVAFSVIVVATSVCTVTAELSIAWPPVLDMMVLWYRQALS